MQNGSPARAWRRQPSCRRLLLSWQAVQNLGAFFRGQFRAAGFFQCRQIGSHQLPQNRRGDTLVVVTQYVADPRNFLPGDLRIARFQIIRKMTTGFGNNLNTAFNEPLSLPIVFECFERHIRQYAIDAFDRLDDVR
jgi:hypothetical protein